MEIGKQDVDYRKVVRSTNEDVGSPEQFVARGRGFKGSHRSGTHSNNSFGRGHFVPGLGRHVVRLGVHYVFIETRGAEGSKRVETHDEFDSSQLDVPGR